MGFLACCVEISQAEKLTRLNRSSILLIMTGLLLVVYHGVKLRAVGRLPNETWFVLWIDGLVILLL